MNPLRIGLSGCGRRGAEVIAAVRDSEHCAIQALHDPDPLALARLGDAAGIALRTTDFGALLATGVDFVVLTGPCGDRLAQVEAAAAQGAHCLLHAPMAVSASDAAAMVACCEQHGVKLGVAVRKQADPTCEQLRQMVADDWLGTPILITALVGDDRVLRHPPPAGHWRRDPARAGRGPLLQLASEALHLAIWLTERRPLRATAIASGGFTPLGEDSAAAVVLLRGGAVLSLTSSHLCRGDALAIHGTDGAVRLARDRLWLYGRRAFAGEMFDYPTPHSELLLPVAAGRDDAAAPWARCELHGRFARWIDDRDDFPCPGDQAADDLRALDAARAAIEQRLDQSVG